MKNTKATVKPAKGITARTATARPFTITEKWVTVEFAIAQEVSERFAEMQPGRAQFIADSTIEECRKTAAHGVEDWFVASAARNAIPLDPTPFTLKLRAWEWAWVKEQAKELAVTPATWLRIELLNSLEYIERKFGRKRGMKTA